MRRIAHISDLHFDRVDDRVVAALCDELNGDVPDLVIVSGDFTQRARRREYLRAREFLAALKAPWFAVPGNHDISFHHLFQRFFDPFGRYRRYIHPDVEPTWQDDEIIVVGINTARRMSFELDWSHGRINEEQIARVERRLRSAPPHLFRIVVGHHPFLPPPMRRRRAWSAGRRRRSRASSAMASASRSPATSTAAISG